MILSVPGKVKSWSTDTQRLPLGDRLWFSGLPIAGLTTLSAPETLSSAPIQIQIWFWFFLLFSISFHLLWWIVQSWLEMLGNSHYCGIRYWVGCCCCGLSQQLVIVSRCPFNRARLNASLVSPSYRYQPPLWHIPRGHFKVSNCQISFHQRRRRRLLETAIVCRITPTTARVDEKAVRKRTYWLTGT